MACNYQEIECVLKHHGSVSRLIPIIESFRFDYERDFLSTK